MQKPVDRTNSERGEGFEQKCSGYKRNGEHNCKFVCLFYEYGLVLCLECCWFLRRGENRSTRRKTSRSKDDNQQQTQPTYDAESENRTRATLCHLCSPNISKFQFDLESEGHKFISLGLLRATLVKQRLFLE